MCFIVCFLNNVKSLASVFKIASPKLVYSCIPHEKIQVNPTFWSGSEILVSP